MLRITASGKATLVPITILIGGKFYDASAYKAAPVPMALESGTVYEGERTGSSLGLFTLDGAQHSTVANSLTPWIGTGKWLPAGTEAAKTSLKAEDVPVGIETSDAPPRLSRTGSASKDAPPTTTASPAAPPASTAPSSTGSSGAPPASTPQNPSTGTSSGSSGSGPAASSPPAAGSATPPAAESKPAGADSHSTTDADSHAKESDNNSGAGDSNRPRLRRGKPVDPLPDEEIPGYSKPGAKPATAPADPAKASAAVPAVVPVQLIPAISDGTGPDPRSFGFEWLKGEEGERLQQMTDFAKQQLRVYMDAMAKNQIPAKRPGPQAARHKPVEPILENAHMVAYDLWTTNQPILVFSAEAHLPPAAGSAQAATDPALQYSITIVARTDIYNNLHKLYLSVTDKNHLDITPRLELVDAVDVDGDGRGELLFRETSDAASGWLIYRASADKLWKVFDSLNPE